MNTYHKTVRMVCIILLGLIAASSDAATLLVESLDDILGTTATLRQTIIDASGGDTIQFDVSGTIFLDEALGELVVNKELIIDGQNKIIVDGQNQLNIGFHITTASASATVIKNISIQNFSGDQVDPGSGTALQDLPAYGIFIENNALNCSISNCTIENILSGSGDVAAGIYSEHTTCPIYDNTITNVSSAPTTNTGDVFGIYIEGDIQGPCVNNTLSQLRSGDATNNSGDVVGIRMEDGTIEGDCIYNTLQDFQSGVANTVGSGNVRGVQVSTIAGDFSCNTMTKFISSGGANTQLSGTIIGCDTGAIDGNCSYNQCTEFTTSTADGSGNIVVFFVRFGISGDFASNTITTMTTGVAESPTVLRASGGITGLITERIEGLTAYNNLRFFSTGEGRWVSGDIFGLLCITFESDVIHNSLIWFSTGNAQFVGDIRGIFSFESDSEIVGRLAHNTLSHFTTGVATSSNPLGGLFIGGLIEGVSIAIIGGAVHDNLLEQFATGATIPTVVGTSETGSIAGIKVRSLLQDDLFNNTVRHMIVSSSAMIVGSGQGIFVQSINSGHRIACNTVNTVHGNSPDGTAINLASYGIAIQQGDSITISHNTVKNLTGLDGSPIYGLVLGDDPSNNSVTNSTVNGNTINNIIGGNQNGFGIVILDENSLGNTLLNNLIFTINGKAIGIFDPLADTTDKTVTLTFVQCTHLGKSIIHGSFNPGLSFINKPFLLQFFVSDGNTPPQAMTLFGEQTVIANNTPTHFVIELKPCPPTQEGQYVTATATALTDPNNNTTELSNAVESCNSLNPLCAAVSCSCTPTPPAVCPINLASVLPVPAPCPPIVIPPCPS